MRHKRIMLDVLKGKAAFPPPLWMMRQAGRYLPEYRETRKRAGSFLDLCYNPDLAVEVTLQPIERFGFDASILFSDILVVPNALGRDVRFEEGRGPLLTPITAAEISALKSETFHVNLEPVYETVRRLRAKLPDETTLIGFCGAPWTVATYMIAGHGTPDQAPARQFGYRDRVGLDTLIDVLVDASAAYLVRQLQAGADAVQIFDTWAGVLPTDEFQRWCIAPTRRIADKVRREVPGAKLIGFPRGAGTMLPKYVAEASVDAVGLDWMIDRAFAREQVQSRLPVQGNVDPLALVAGGAALDRAVDAALEAFAGGPFIFNLGHGIVPQTPIEHVEQMLKRVRG